MLGAGVILNRVDPGDRRRDRRRAVARRRARLVRRRVRPAARRTFPGGEFGAAVRAGREAAHRGRAPRQGEAQRHPARARRRRRDQPVDGAVLDVDAGDLFGLTAALVAVPSESHHEAELADAGRGAACATRAPSLSVDADRRQRDRAHRARPRPARRARRASRHRARQRQRGAACRRRRAARPRLGRHEGRPRGAACAWPSVCTPIRRRARYDVTLAFYECEEVARRVQRAAARCSPSSPSCSPATSPCCSSPPTAWVEAGCQGVLVREGRVRRRACPHAPARGWVATPSTGRRRCWRASRRTRPTSSTSTGSSSASRSRWCGIEGGVAEKHNVVPDRCTITVNRRFAPKYSPRRPRRRCGRCSTAPTTSRSSRRSRRPRPTSPTRWSTSSCAGSSFRCVPSWAGPTSPASRRAACPPSTSVPATRPSPTPQGEFVTRDVDRERLRHPGEVRGSSLSDRGAGRAGRYRVRPMPAPPELYRWQLDALVSWLRCGRRGVIEAVTGSGKTDVAIAAASDALAPGPVRAGGRAVPRAHGAVARSAHRRPARRPHRPAG